MSELDFNIFKAITSDKSRAMDFVYHFDHKIFNEDVQDIAHMVTDYIKSYRDLPTKRTLLARYGDTTETTERIDNFWTDLQNHNYDTKEYSYDIEEFKNRYVSRLTYKIQKKLDINITQKKDPDLILKDLALQLQAANVVKEGRSHIQKSVGDYVPEFTARYIGRQNGEIQGVEIKTGYSMLDSVTGGLSPAELILVGGETAAGKSQLLNNIAAQMWMQGNNIDTPADQYTKGYSVLYFSLEMPYDDCFDRLIARMADIPQRKTKQAKLDEREEFKMKQALKFFEDYQAAGNHFQIVDVPRNVTIEEIELRYTDALLQFRPDIVVIDYMGLMHDHNLSKEQDWLKMGAIAASLHEFSRAYDVVMLTAVQLTDVKRGTKGKSQDENQNVGVHRIGRSSHIMHHVNVGIQIETRFGETSLPDLKYHVIKNRKGPLGKGNMIKNFENGALFDVPYLPESASGDISGNIAELLKNIRDNNG